MSSAGVRLVLKAMGETTGPGSGLAVDVVAQKAACSVSQTRAALTTMLGLSPAWIDGDVVPDRGLVWWLTPTGHEAAFTAHGADGASTAPASASR